MFHSSIKFIVKIIGYILIKKMTPGIVIVLSDMLSSAAEKINYPGYRNARNKRMETTSILSWPEPDSIPVREYGTTASPRDP